MPASRLTGRTLGLTVRDRTRFGAGALADLPEAVAEAGGARAFVVTDPGVVASGVAGRVVERLEAAGVEALLWPEVEPNPDQATVERGRAALLAFGVDAAIVVAVGGGSSMDTAKAVSLAAANRSVAVADLGYDKPSLRPGLPVIAVPTTAGTGAETNAFGVITDGSAGRKDYIGHPSLLPVVCILDPELTLGLPPGPTAATGVDAMTHSLESLLSANPNPFAEALALQVVRTVGAWLPVAVADGTDLVARSELLFAAHLAGLGQASGTGVGAVHAIGHAMGTVGRLPHGTALATVLPEVLATYLDVRERELGLVAAALGSATISDAPGVAARAGVDAVHRLLVAVGQRPTLADHGLGPADERRIVEDAVADPAIRNSPRVPTAAEVAAILASVRG